MNNTTCTVCQSPITAPPALTLTHGSRAWCAPCYGEACYNSRLSGVAYKERYNRRQIMEAHLGEKLPITQAVYFVNGLDHDPRIENLATRSNRPY